VAGLNRNLWKLQMGLLMKSTKQDEKCPYPPSSTPITDEAHARWAEGEISWIDEMAKLELEVYEQCKLLDMSGEREYVLRGELERWRDCARMLAALGMPKSWQNSDEWYKAMEFYRKLQKQDEA
jgi:hypothetical protein